MEQVQENPVEQPIETEAKAEAEVTETNTEKIQSYINNELRFAEETILRAVRQCVMNCVNAISNN